MHRQIDVALLPGLCDPLAVADNSLVVTDVLRATTTIIAALSNGARQVIPTPDISKALQLKTELGPDAVLGGERGGVIIPGFHQGNSPREFCPEIIHNRDLVLCTTNGTVAMEACRGARQVLVGAFVNLTAVVERLARAPRALVLCAGTDGQITSEDALFAGAVVARLLQSGPATLGDQAAIALGWWQSANLRIAQGERLAELLGQGRGGKNLRKLKYDADIEFCAEVDRLPIVPELDTARWRIR